MMVFIIEDDPWQAEQFSRQLEKAGYQTQTFNNGVDAIHGIDETLPNAIILDVLLAGTTGMTLLHELQSYSDTGVIPVVLCTGLAESVKLDQVADYGVKRILDKATMQPDDIVAAIRSVI